MSTRILLVEDEEAIRDAVATTLRREGHDVDECDTGEAGLARALEGRYDVVLLDVLLPGLSGFEVCRRLRAERDVPIVMLTARESEAERVLGLDAGADDYLVKPFSMLELASRVRAVLRRRELDAQGGSIRRVGDLELDLGLHEVRVAGRSVPVTPSELRLLLALAEEPGRVVSRDALVRQLWSSEHVGSRRACDAHIVNLRRKLERDPENPERLVTVRGAGYRLVVL